MTLKSTHSFKKIQTTLILLIAALPLLSCGRHESSDSSGAFASSIIVGSLDWKEIIGLSNNSPIKVNAKAVADVKLPVMGSRCTGFMISENILMTNHHCVPSSRYAEGITASFNHLKGVGEADWASFDCSTFIGNNRTLDFALLECSGSPGTEFGMVELSDDDQQIGTPLYIVQQNCDYYSDRDCDWSKKYSKGKITKKDDEYTHNADTLGGSSGSPVFSQTSNKVIAIHHAGRGNNGQGRGTENYAVPMYKIVNAIQSDFPQVDIGASGDDSGNGNGDGDSDDSTSNNSFETATEVTNFPYQNKDETSSDKFFKVNIAKSGKLTIGTSFSHSVGDLDLAFYNAEKSKLKISQGTTGTENISQEVNAGTYFVKVYGYKSAEAPFTLNIKFEAKKQVASNGTFETATKIKTSFVQQGFSISSSKDLDFYKFTVTSGTYLNLSINFSHSVGDLDLYLYNGSRKQLAKSDSVSNNESVSKYFSKGTYYLKVKGYKGASGKYGLSLK
ncbi:MAG: trypsin-like serine protease [Halobacteriovoraceae bacterium]|jgi:V8-like Glu-specific endopeptidase|nr:trypsin-like serine protease [Halobacteriovoraceae bacterium]MBT5092781.1 trypsin-like serine protease [Halobacteriovoraceae bacterium]